jgi:hypothetical protein
MAMMFYILILLITGFNAQVHIKDVNVITLYSNEYTTGRRNIPIPQMRCVGPACSEGALKSMQCTNMGFDGSDANWDCKADVGNRFTLGKVSVSCEGYEFPDDPRILVGSCGVEYELQFNPNYQPRTHQPRNNRDVTVTTWWDPLYNRYYNTYSYHDEILFVCFCCIGLFGMLLIIACASSRPRITHTPSPIYTPSSTIHSPPPPTYYPPSYYDYYPRTSYSHSYWPSWTNPIPVARTTYTTSTDGPSSGSFSEHRGARTTRR